jgi:hypothetical protein
VILASVSSSLTANVRDHGLYAVFVLMAIDAVLPAASELVMVVGGAVAAGAFGASFSLFGNDLAHGFKSYLAVSIAGTLGRCSSSTAAGSTSAPRTSDVQRTGSRATRTGRCSSDA